MNLRLLDLFCCAGGASQGYHQAGFDVVGVDIDARPGYPFEFHQGDALEYLENNFHKFDVVHASPPCQKYTNSAKLWSGREYPDLVAPVREILLRVKKPFVIENVPGSPLINPIILCGTMFGLRTYRHRLFESNFKITPPVHERHVRRNAKMGRPPKENEMLQLVGNFSGVSLGREIIGCPWMNRYELAQSIPTAYTEFIGRQFIEYSQSV